MYYFHRLLRAFYGKDSGCVAESAYNSSWRRILVYFDTRLRRVELPAEKLERISKLAADYAERSKITKHELQILVGHMSFASRAIHGARAFTRIFIDEIKNKQAFSPRASYETIAGGIKLVAHLCGIIQWAMPMQTWISARGVLN